MAGSNLACKEISSCPPDSNRSFDLFSDAKSRLEDIFRRLDAPDDVRQRLSRPALSLKVSIPVRLDPDAADMLG